MPDSHLQMFITLSKIYHCTRIYVQNFGCLDQAFPLSPPAGPAGKNKSFNIWSLLTRKVAAAPRGLYYSKF
jgi:hypothetical protein